MTRLARIGVVALALLGGTLAMPAQPAQASGSSTRAFKSVQLYGVDYVEAREFGKRFGLTATWTEAKKKLRLRSQWTTLDLTVDSLDVWLNGLRLFLGEPAILHKNHLHISIRDVETLFGPILAPRPVSRPAPALKIIAVDAGHGGNDPGTRNPRLKLDEKEFTLDVAKRLEVLLKAQGYIVVMTRRNDRRVELEERTEIARKANADLFVSIHFNAHAEERVAGTETYVMPPRLQRSSPAAEADKTMVSTAFPSNKYDYWNIILGYHMHRQIVASLNLPDRGLKRYRYSVLRTADCPAVLVEAAFISNDTEGRKVASPAYRQQLAETFAAGIKAYGDALEQARAGK